MKVKNILFHLKKILKNEQIKKKFLKNNNIKAKEKWKSTLTKNDIRTIEFVCFNEMRYMNYKTINKYSEFDNTEVSNIKTFPTSELASWIKPYAIDQKKKNLNQIITEEKRRIKLIKKKLNISNKIKFKFQII